MKQSLKKVVLLFVLFTTSNSVVSGTLYSQSFETKAVPSQFPYVNDSFQLPNYPVTEQLDWFIQQLSMNDTSLSDINKHFNLSSIGLSAQEVKDFIQAIRETYPNAIMTDVIMMTPISTTLLIADPMNMSQYGFLNLSTEFSFQKRIKSLSVSNYFGSVQFPADQNLTMSQALDKFQTLSSQSSILVASLDEMGNCQALFERNSSNLRATGSIFKVWILAAAAQAFISGEIQLEQVISLVESELALGGAINSEPIGTEFSLLEIATLMMGISDNTATDLLHETLGRNLINQTINSIGLSMPNALTPLLGISEQFHLFFSFDLETSLSYVNGTEAFQEMFLTQNIEPLGPLTSFPFNNDSLFVNGSWRASPMDICQSYAHLRNLPEGSDALKMVDMALGSGVAQPEVRNFWDRVWYKGGSLISGINGYQVLTHSWMLENKDEQPLFVIAMANNPDGNIDIFNVQSVTGRILELTKSL